MRQVYAAGEALLRQGLRGLGETAPSKIPLRLDRAAGTLRSALPRALRPGGDAAALACALAACVEPAYPFSGAEAAGGMVVLTLSRAWMFDVLARHPAPEGLVLPARTGVRRCDREDTAFLLSYTARRCLTLAKRPGETDTLPPALLCALAEEPPDPRQVAELYWRQPPQVRRQPELAGAVAAVLQNVHRKPEPTQ